MIYNENTPYSVKFYTTGSASPVIEFIDSLPVNHQAKILSTSIFKTTSRRAR